MANSATRAHAPIDRRVRVLGGRDQDDVRLSTLLDTDRLVLLGQPGMGKSKTFEHLALRDGGSFRSVRVLKETAAAPAEPVFIDALDEYRAEGMARDKAHEVASAIKRLGISRWRLTCREEDWTDADQAVLSADIVATLLPLEKGEAAEVLAAHGVSNPEDFVHRATELGSDALIGNPLLLLLLHRSVAADGDWRTGDWPRTRLELYRRATALMAVEENKEHHAASRGTRPTPTRLLELSGKAFALMLLSGEEALVTAPGVRGVNLDDLHTAGFNTLEFTTALDTKLWRLEGDGWVPAHRTVAEYLGGETLARAVAGAGGLAFPLARIRALVTGGTGAPPTVLRGLYAWLTTHLSHGRRSPLEAAQLIEASPETVLFYGDAASLTLEHRRCLLQAVGRKDPWFLRFDQTDAVLAGLADPNLKDDLIAILADPGESPHRKALVLAALVASPIPELAPVLDALVQDGEAASIVRREAAEALITGSPDPVATRKSILTSLSDEASETAFAIRMSAAADLVPNHLSATEVRVLIRSITEAPGGTMGFVYPLREALAARPMPRIFAAPVFEDALMLGETRDFEARGVRDDALAAAIRTSRNLHAKRLIT